VGKPTGFLENGRLVPLRRDVKERLKDWREVDQTGDAAAMRVQGGRCMDCGVPFCTQGCPLGNPIPEFADLVYRDRWRDAYRVLASTNDFPEFTGRLCPAPCEGACVLGIPSPEPGSGSNTVIGPEPGSGSNTVIGPEPGSGSNTVIAASPITIEHLERAIADRAFAEGWVVAEPPRARTGHRVGVIGSGPAGLAAAAQLNRAGHYVTVYEAAAEPGGLLRYGIPDFKLEKALVERRIALLVAEGVDFTCGVRVGVDRSWEAVRADHDAIVLAVGAMTPRDLAIPGRELPGVVIAMDYLNDRNLGISLVHGKHVVILGGGDTGSDCLGTAHRDGAASVAQIELLPPPPTARAAANPWPTYPMVFRTSSSQEEGGARDFGFRTTHLEAGAGGRLAKLHGVRVDTGEAVTLPCDVLVLALGFTGPALPGLDVARDARGNVATDARYATSIPGIYAAGDAKRGASLIVWAIAEGREAARHVDSYLRRAPSQLPAIGQDSRF
jgi:glutamate synthase (NADPH/NADH) small chain